MNIRESNRMNMFTATNAVLELFGNKTAKIPALDESVKRFNGKLVHITRRDAQYTTAAVGVTASKNSAAEACISETLKIANALYVLGHTTANEQLKAECHLTPSQLSAVRMIELVKIFDRVSELAKQFTTELGTYGVTKADITSHTNAIAVFRKTREEQQQRLTEVKSARSLLSEDLAEANDILRNQVDPLMELVKHSDTEFYNQYRAARVIRDLHGRGSKKADSTAASGTATTQTILVAETAAA